jgi:hypothetical protein
MDFSKAFDKVPRQWLVKKVQAKWLDPGVVTWIESSVGCNVSPAMGARNQIGIGLSYRPASLCSLATQFQTRFLESIPRPIAGLKFSALTGSDRQRPCV